VSNFSEQNLNGRPEPYGFHYPLELTSTGPAFDACDAKNDGCSPVVFFFEMGQKLCPIY
jgi:hypothetical protein